MYFNRNRARANGTRPHACCGWTSVRCFGSEAHATMNCETLPKYSLLDFVFTLIGVCTFLFDVGSDLCVAKEFYTHGEFVWCGVFVGFMLISSVVVQLFSWFWLQYDRGLKDFESQASAGNLVLFSGAKRVKLLLFLHVCQLGFFIRWETGVTSRECYKIFIYPPIKKKSGFQMKTFQIRFLKITYAF